MATARRTKIGFANLVCSSLPSALGLHSCSNQCDLYTRLHRYFEALPQRRRNTANVNAVVFESFAPFRDLNVLEDLSSKVTWAKGNSAGRLKSCKQATFVLDWSARSCHPVHRPWCNLLAARKLCWLPAWGHQVIRKQRERKVSGKLRCHQHLRFCPGLRRSKLCTSLQSASTYRVAFVGRRRPSLSTETGRTETRQPQTRASVLGMMQGAAKQAVHRNWAFQRFMPSTETSYELASFSNITMLCSLSSWFTAMLSTVNCIHQSQGWFTIAGSRSLELVSNLCELTIKVIHSYLQASCTPLAFAGCNALPNKGRYAA